MPNTLQRIVVRRFRNLEQVETEFTHNLTVITGPNGAGKTNLIEAIQLVTTTDSFRRPHWNELVMNNSTQTVVSAHILDAGVSTDIEMRVTEATGRTYFVNNKKRKKAAEIIGRCPSVVFSPDDLFMIKGPAEERRRAVDEVGDQVSAGYRALKRDYNRILKQRNAALKSESNHSALVELDEQLTRAAGRLVAHRARLTRMIALRAEGHYSALAGGESVETEFVPSWNKYGISGDVYNEDEAARMVSEGLERTRKEECARGMTLIGPHKDDIVFRVEEADSRRAASQGQQRSIALAWKFAEVDVIEEVSGKRPVLLLDDVMSELDAARRAALTQLVEQGTQTVITTANIDYFDQHVLQEALVIQLGG